MALDESHASDEVNKPEIIVLASTSNAKIEPTKQSACEVFGNAEIIASKSESGVSDNPFTAAETLMGAVNRWRYIAERFPENVSQTLAIESGILPTQMIPAEETFVFKIAGKFSDAASIDFASPPEFTRINGITGKREVVDIEQTPLNIHDNNLKADALDTQFLDRAVVVTYDVETDTTFIGISRGVAFPAEAVKEAIIDHSGKERVSDAMLRNLIKEGKVAEDGTILTGPLTGRKFDVQDPQSYLTNGQLPRAMQLSEITKSVFQEIAANRE